MKLRDNPPLHLTYCLNVHPGESWVETFAAVRDKALAVKRRVAPDRPFGLGLRLGNQAARELSEERNLTDFRKFLDANGLYVFTVNGFPYGTFHGTRVKEDVYRPDWSDRRRLAYTNLLADVLAALLPEGMNGSISTVPLCYGKTPPRLDTIIGNLERCAAHLADDRARTGRHVALALEPEPDCLIENTDETLSFFAGIDNELFRRHVGVCVDVCHLALAFEDPKTSIERLTDSGVIIPKVQLSSALRLTPTRTATRQLAEFADPVYLHQVKVRTPGGEIRSYADLDAAPEVCGDEEPDDEEWRVHFHVPLYLDNYGELKSTSAVFTPQLAHMLTSGVSEHLEIETYTFDVLPETVREPDVVGSIAREFEWVRAFLAS